LVCLRPKTASVEDPRKNNFSASEIAISTENVEENLHVSQSKLTNSVINQRQKYWTPITVTERCGSGEEISGEVRGKWKNLNFFCKVYRIHKILKRNKELAED